MMGAQCVSVLTDSYPIIMQTQNLRTPTMRTHSPFPAPFHSSTHLPAGFLRTRFSRLCLASAALACLTIGLAPLGFAGVFQNPEKASEHPDFAYQGEFLGNVILEDETEPTRVGIQLAARGDGKFEGFVYPGGLPGDGWTPEDGGRESITAQRTDDHVQTESFRGVTFRNEDGGLVGRDEEDTERGVLERVVRTSPTEGKAPIDEAIVLFDGSNVDKWQDGAKIVEDDLLEQGARSADHYGDMYLHLEFRPGFMPNAGGERRANSGVYIQNRYEVQILDSFAMPDNASMNAALYKEKAPKLNMSFPPLQWQTYDIFFRAPRFDDEGEKTENTRITVFHNGVLVHDDAELKSGTGVGGGREEVPKEHIWLQNHTGPIYFRNVWLVEDPDAAESALKALKAASTP